MERPSTIQVLRHVLKLQPDELRLDPQDVAQLGRFDRQMAYWHSMKEWILSSGFPGMQPNPSLLAQIKGLSLDKHRSLTWVKFPSRTTGLWAVEQATKLASHQSSLDRARITRIHIAAALVVDNSALKLQQADYWQELAYTRFGVMVLTFKLSNVLFDKFFLAMGRDSQSQIPTAYAELKTDRVSNIGYLPENYIQEVAAYVRAIQLLAPPKVPNDPTPIG